MEQENEDNRLKEIMPLTKKEENNEDQEKDENTKDTVKKIAKKSEYLRHSSDSDVIIEKIRQSCEVLSTKEKGEGGRDTVVILKHGETGRGVFLTR